MRRAFPKIPLSSRPATATAAAAGGRGRALRGAAAGAAQVAGAAAQAARLPHGRAVPGRLPRLRAGAPAQGGAVPLQRPQAPLQGPGQGAPRRARTHTCTDTCDDTRGALGAAGLGAPAAVNATGAVRRVTSRRTPRREACAAQRSRGGAGLAPGRAPSLVMGGGRPQRRRAGSRARLGSSARAG